MNFSSIKEFNDYMREIHTNRFKLVAVICNVLNASLGDDRDMSNEIVSLRIATIASLMDLLDGMDQKIDTRLYDTLNDAISEGIAKIESGRGIDNLKELIVEIRASAKASIDRINDGDSILKGVDFNLN